MNLDENSFPQISESFKPFQDEISLKQFALSRQIGEGAFAKVYKANWISMDVNKTPNTVAVKVISKNIISSPELEGKFHNEVKLLASMPHEFIIKYYSSFENVDSLIIVLEYVSTNLFQILQEQIYFGESTARYFSSQIILGLQFLHASNVAYRDLKPENTLISSKGGVKLTDFSFSKRIPGRSYTCQGTLEYMAPEIILNQGHGLAVDWWAFGVLLYELCAGHSPFRSRFQLALMKNISHAKYKFPSHFSEELRDLIKRLIVCDVTQRLGSTKGKIDSIKNHAWYADEIEWDQSDQYQFALPKELRELDVFETEQSDMSDIDESFGVFN